MLWMNQFYQENEPFLISKTPQMQTTLREKTPICVCVFNNYRKWRTCRPIDARKGICSTKELNCEWFDWWKANLAIWPTIIIIHLWQFDKLPHVWHSAFRTLWLLPHLEHFATIATQIALLTENIALDSTWKDRTGTAKLSATQVNIYRKKSRAENMAMATKKMWNELWASSTDNQTNHSMAAG